ncbi:tetratricopeptide repeat protein [Kangiella shandongensis]|uniref:tetratricopeptide repeat protein n=1 Tax=Kangiella shandongensis TaxID=2763258 RepID=UPI001CBC51FD|nr:tetratricopeptide repeat protein [Kangiella shandongensis]
MMRMINIRLTVLLISLISCEVAFAFNKKSDCEDLYNLYPSLVSELKKAEGSEKNISNLQDEVTKVCKKEAFDGNPLSQFRLAHINYYGFGKKPDITKALYWFMQSERQGIVGSRVMLGQLFFDGEYLDKDIPLAYYWFVKANSDLEVFDKKFCDNFINILSEDEIDKIEKKVQNEENVEKLGTCTKK